MPATVHPNPLIIRPPADLLTRHPTLGHLSKTLALKYAYRELVTDDALRDIGQRLWQALDITDDFDAAKQVAGAQILPLIIESAEAAVQQLPWETLVHPAHGFLGQSPSFTLSRRTTEAARNETPPQVGPLRVLMFTSLPDDLHPELSRLNVEEEQAQVQEALSQWAAEGLVTLEMPDDGRFATLQEMLRTFRPHLVFLSGHGKFYHQPHNDDPPYGVFIFEDNSGHSAAIHETRIAEAFVGSGVQCVVLSACESGKAASEALNHGLTRQLSQLGLPHVIGMRESVLDLAGIQFARHFCDAVARKERVDVAFTTSPPGDYHAAERQRLAGSGCRCYERTQPGPVVSAPADDP